MHQVRLHPVAQRSIDTLMSCNGTFAIKFGRNQRGEPMAAITSDFKVFTGQSGGNKGFKQVSGHIQSVKNSGTNAVAYSQQVQCQNADSQHRHAHHAQT